VSEIHPDFEEFFALLNARKIRFLVIGGVARNAYVEPRFTRDIDIWIEPLRANCERLLEALHEFGFPAEQIDIDELLTLPKVIFLGVAPWRIDLLTRPSGLEFNGCWHRRTAGNYGRAAVSYLGMDDLITGKRAAGRMRDLADVADLERARERWGDDDFEER